MLVGGVILLMVGLGMLVGLQDQVVGNFNLANLGWVGILGGALLIALHFINRRTAPAVEPRRSEVVVDKRVDEARVADVDRRGDIV